MVHPVERASCGRHRRTRQTPRTRTDTLLLALDLAGTFAFALNGVLTAVRTIRLDNVGVVTLGMITALGGGTIRDILLAVAGAYASAVGRRRRARWLRAAPCLSRRRGGRPPAVPPPPA